MADPRFFDNAGPFTLARIAGLTGGKPARDTDLTIADLCALDSAGPGLLSYCESVKFRAALERTKAGAVLVGEAFAASVPSAAVAIICAQPALAFAKVAGAFYPDAGLIWPKSKPPVQRIAPTSQVGKGTVIAPDVFIGEGVEIGNDCVIGPGAVIGRGVQIGHNAQLGAHVSISHSLIGDRCTIHAGTRIGQDGFSYVSGAAGHFKVPQLGRVIIQDDVEIGANAAIDRGALGDTVIGEGTKLDNMVHIAHNNRIGRRCIIVAQVGIAGSSEIGDFAVLGGQVGVGDHVKIGAGTFVAGKSGVTRNLEAGKVYAGYPAHPIEQWRREVGTLARLTKASRSKNERDAGKD
ncbi:MAG: UDP-3-O-(3-hydroxymyristoyl)glucosamine N-acyltransferase [Alphaproteobacteria bacterium]|nr:UDP-3-O-(3-hydroxymyristoyl)glucosamine N-acyltransferase [Alphaproteobacteria bacterium]